MDVFIILRFFRRINW